MDMIIFYTSLKFMILLCVARLCFHKNEDTFLGRINNDVDEIGYIFNKKLYLVVTSYSF